MSNQHYSISGEVEVTIKVKIKDLRISTYQHLNEIQQAENVTHFKQEIGRHLKDKLSTSYNQEEITFGVDWWSFEIE
ncbi:MAG: hypothetical protein OSB25_07660 [Salibacteraceae bacterium]|mgnify:CR=1 FL=1|nr:hypothetical protein [Salibacteraceae bacterium]|tara:strand:+ start:28350 stop:28580 length:231 start_codon:yes stop_codon:yes gene_type:complete